MSIITRSNHPSLYWPGIESVFGNSYKEQEQYWKQLFTMRKSKKAHEEIAQVTGFGLAVEKPEGEPILYDSTKEQGPPQRFLHTVYALGFVVTREAKEDILYKEVAFRRARSLGRAMRTTKEIVHHHVFNMAFDNTAPGMDGQPLVSTQHGFSGGMQSNQIAVAADISEVAIEDMITQLSLFRDQRGHFISVRPKSLLIHPSQMFEAERILGSSYQSNSESNNINVLKAKKFVPKIIASPYLSVNDGFFILTDVDDGLICYQRRPLEFWEDNPDGKGNREFDSHNAKYQANERYAVGFADWRAVIGSPGA